jgi:hypothetical protein
MVVNVALIFVLLTFLPLAIMANFNPRDAITCNGGLIICGRKCIPATSNCCSGGSYCANGGTCFTDVDGNISCCPPSRTCTAASGSSVIAPAVPTCRDDKPLLCHNQCIGINETCCSKGGWCSNSQTCFLTEVGGEACSKPGKTCVASGGLTVIVAPTGAVEPSAVTAIATATSTTVMTAPAPTLASSSAEKSFLTATASSSRTTAAP